MTDAPDQAALVGWAVICWARDRRGHQQQHEPYAQDQCDNRATVFLSRSTLNVWSHRRRAINSPASARMARTWAIAGGAFVTPGKFDERDAHQRHGCGDVVRQDAPGAALSRPRRRLTWDSADLPTCRGVRTPVAQSCAATASDPQIAVNACRVGIFMMRGHGVDLPRESRMPR